MSHAATPLSDQPYRFLEIHPIAGSLGAELSGVDLGTLNDDVFDEIYRAFVDYQVIFFRGQSLDPDAYLAFGKRWGEIKIYPYMKGLASHPEILEVLKTEKDTYAFGNQWHTDSSFTAIPPKATMLYALELPAAGGDTEFANMYDAYDALSPGMRAMLSGLSVLNVGDKQMARFAELSDMKQQDPGDVQVRTVHPAIRTHPDTGRKSLFVSSHTVEFDGMTPEESAPLIGYLKRHAARPEFTCRFRWQVGSMAIWDNRCTQHYAIDDYAGQRRYMHRITIEGEEAPY